MNSDYAFNLMCVDLRWCRDKNWAQNEGPQIWKNEIISGILDLDFNRFFYENQLPNIGNHNQQIYALNYI